MKQKKRNSLKRGFARFLAASMVFAQCITAAGISALAAELPKQNEYGPHIAGADVGASGEPKDADYGHPSHLVFDTGYGPGVKSANDDFYKNLNAANPAGGASANWKLDNVTLSGNYKAYGWVFKGTAGQPLINVMPGGHTVATNTAGVTQKPALPWGGTGSGATPTWDGFVFQNWINLKTEQAVQVLPVAFPYESYRVYRAVWAGDSLHKKHLKLFYFYNKNQAADPVTAANVEAKLASPIPGVLEKLGTENVELTATASVERTSKPIPGFKLADTDPVTLDKNTILNGDTPAQSVSGSGLQLVPPDKKIVKGVMPNQDAVAAFRYEVDPNKKFKVHLRYADMGGNPINPIGSHNDEVQYPALSEMDVASPLTAANFVQDAEGDPQYILDSVDTAITESGEGEIPARNISQSPDLHMKGVIGNRDVTVTFKYKINPAFTSMVTVSYIKKTYGQPDEQMKDASGVPIPDQSVPAQPGTVQHLTLPSVPSGYTVSATSPDMSKFDTLDVNAAQTQVDYTVNSAAGGAIQVIYQANVNDPTAFTQVNLSASTGGVLDGGLSSGYFHNGAVTLRQILTQLYGNPAVENFAKVAPGEAGFYQFENWYRADGSGQKSGNALNLEDSITLSGAPLSLVAYFKKDPSGWLDIEFKKGTGLGTLTPAAGASLHYTGVTEIKRGTKTFQDLVPAVAATAPWSHLSQYGASWRNGAGAIVADYDSGGNLHVYANELDASDVFTFNFAEQINDDGMYRIPDARGSVAGDGSGQIHVNAPSTFRDYVVTDENGNIIARKSGADLRAGDFTGLTPGQGYQVYEIPKNHPAAPGSNVSAISPISQPAAVSVPALGANYQTAPGTDNLRRIVVNPAAPNTQYALVDESGTVVMPEGSADGFVTPTGGQVVFDNLDPNTNYTVVARPIGGSTTPQEALPNGTSLNTGEGSGGSVTEGYDLNVILPGKISGVTRNGTPVTVTDEHHMKLNKDDQVTINAPSVDAGKNFKRWNQILGINVLSSPDSRTVSFIMPADSLYFEPSYATLAPAYPGLSGNADDLTVDFGPKNGDFGIPSVTLDTLREMQPTGFATSSDITALNNGVKISYRVNFEKRAGVAAADKALLEAASGFNADDTEYAWEVRIRLKRSQTPGASADVTAAYTDVHGIEAYAKIPAALRSADISDLQLWRIRNGAASEVTPPGITADSTELQLGSDAYIGDQYVLTYKRRYQVTLQNASGDATDAPASASLPQSYQISRGDPLNSVGGYLTTYAACPDNLDGERYLKKGLSSDTAHYLAFNDARPIRTSTTVYVWYEENPSWTQSHNNLGAAINDANALLGGSSLRPDQIAALQPLVNDAVNLFNQVPSASIADMDNMTLQLRNMLDSLRGGGGSGGGGGGGGGTGGGGSGSGSISGGTTQPSKVSVSNTNIFSDPSYEVGVDGKWILVDEANHKWVFELNNGVRLHDTWAVLRYSYNGVMRRDTYHFASDDIMDNGWMKRGDEWYYLSSTHDGFFGHMMTGWHHDPQDQRWYYLNPIQFNMVKGWKKIDGLWYYFTEQASKQSWFYNDATRTWEYRGDDVRPYGSMYVNEQTPDGHIVGVDGSWTQDRP